MARKKSGDGGSAGKRKRTGKRAKADAAETSDARSPEAAPPAPHHAPGTPRNQHTPPTPRTVADLGAGDHLCCLYETEEEHRAVLTPYLRRGLERGEKVIYIVDSRTAKTVLGYLRDDGLDPEPYVARGQLAILTREETYLRGGAFDPAGMIALLRAETARALAEGYAALRVTGEMTWASRGLPGSERLIEYEVLLNEFLPGSRCLAICQYDRRRFEPAVLLDVLRIHPQVAIGPDACDNPHFVPPAEFCSAERAAAELRRWMQGLTESKRSEKALRESEERFSLVIAGTGVGTWDWNIQTGATVYNERWAEIAGYALAELEPVSQKTWRDLVHPEDLERSDEALRRHLVGESERYECEFRMKHKDGRWVCVHDRGMVVEWTDDGKPLRITGTHSDVTDRRRAEEELRRAEARMELFFSQSLDGFFFRMLDEPVHWDDTADKEKVLDYVFAHQRITKVNDAMLAQYGATREQLTGLTPNDMFAHDVAYGRRVWRELFDAGRLHVDTDERKLDGTKMWIEGDYICMYDSAGRITGHFGAQRDVTEHKRAEEELRKLASVVRCSSELVNLATLDGGMIFLNEAGSRMLGISPAEVEHFNIMQVIPAHLKEKVETELLPALRGAGTWAGELQYLNLKTGRLTDVYATTFTVKDPATGAPLYLANVSRDITERIRTDEALRESEERYRTLVESALDGIVIHVGDRVAFANRAAAAMLGFAGPAALVGQPLASFVHPDDLASAEDRVRRVLAGEAVAYPVEVRYVRRDGTGLPVENTGVLASYKGKPAILSVIRDITERKRAEEALRNSLSLVEATLESTDNGILVVDREGSVVKANGRFAEMWRIPGDILASGEDAVLLDRVVSQLSDPDAFLAKVKALYDDPGAESADLVHFKDGRVFERISKPMLVGGEPKARVWSFLDVTDRKRTEEALRESEEKFSRAFRTSPYAIAITHADDGKFVEVNDAFTSMTGFTREAALADSSIGLKLWVNDADRQRVVSALGAGLAVVGQEFQFRIKSGEVLTGLFSAQALRLGTELCVLASIADITDRKRAEEALRQSENRLRSIFRVAPTGIGVIRDRILLEVNARICEMTGYTREELIGKSARVYYPTQEEFEYVGQEKRRQMAERGIDVIETRWMNKDGSIVDVLLSSAPIDATDPGMGDIFTALDITERKRTEEALRGSEERYRALFENSAVAIGMRSPDGGYLEFNSAYLEMLGYTREELLSRRTADVTHPEDVEISRSNMAAVAEGRATSRRYEKRYVHKNGSVVWGDVCIRPLRDGDGKVVAIVGAVVDVTEHKEAEESLRLRSLALNAAANAVIITDREGGIEWVNLAFLALTGYREDEVIGRNPRVLTKSGVHGRAFYANLWDTVLAGDVWHGELTNRRKDGSVYSEEMTITPLRDERGEIDHFIAVKQDITEQKLLQAEFVQSQKMESVGRLAGGIAHDFNNLLSVINGYAELAVADRSLSTPLRAQIVAIHRAGERAATLTRQLLAFSRRQTVEPVVLDLNDAIRAVQKMLERLIGEDITLVFAPTEPLGRVRADPGQLEQVMMNLVINARDAMPAGGMLGIETANVELDREAAERVSVKPGSYVMLAISDIGMGMDEVTREHIFEPFFTTKGSGKGTGLGLAIVYGIVQQFGGGIQVTSTVGQGTTFSIYLPWVETPVSEEAATPPAPAQAVGGTETILVVEDDESLRTMAADVLASVGYTVLQARHGEEALQVLARHGEPVHLVFTDMVMPGMGGLELAEEVGKTQPQTKVLFTSGFASDATAGRVGPEELTHFICKPYSVVQLARKVREVLDWLW